MLAALHVGKLKRSQWIITQSWQSTITMQWNWKQTWLFFCSINFSLLTCITVNTYTAPNEDEQIGHGIARNHVYIHSEWFRTKFISFATWSESTITQQQCDHVTLSMSYDLISGYWLHVTHGLFIRTDSDWLQSFLPVENKKACKKSVLYNLLCLHARSMRRHTDTWILMELDSNKILKPSLKKQTKQVICWSCRGQFWVFVMFMYVCVFVKQTGAIK